MSPNDRYNWISLVQRSHLDPGKLVENYSGRLRQIIQEKIDIGYEVSDKILYALYRILKNN